MIYNETRYNTHWNTKKLSDLGIFARGKSKHRPRDDKRLYEGGGYPLIQTGDVKAANLYITKHEQEYGEFGLAQSKLWDTGTLCITIAANIAETAILSYPMCFPDSVVGFRAFSEESSELFMHYVFTYIRNSIQNSVSGSIQDNINIDYLSQLDFKIPDKAYQDKVVGILGTIDQKIDTNNRICEELESMAKTLYDYWFVQFDFPDANGKPYRASGGEMVWNEQLKREIPKGWSAQPLSYYLDCNKHTIKRSEWKSDIEYLDTGSLTSNRIGEVQRYETIEEAPSRAQRIVYPNDILYSTVRPNQCHYGLIKTPSPNLVASSGFVCLASKFGAEYNDLFYAFLSSTRIVERLTSIAASSVSAYPSINPNDIMELLIALPERLETIRAMSDRLCELFSAVAHYQTENRELSQLRDWLLPMLMNGQATVAPAETAPKLQVLQPEKPACDPRFDRWLQTQGVAARGTVDEQTLHDIFDAMDDDDKQ